MKLQRRNLLLCPARFPPQRLNPNLHPAEGEPFLAQVIQRNPDRIDRVVDAEETVAPNSATSKISEKCTFLDDILWEKCIFADEK